jgi:D-arabinose 1-dehydrogenase-like Zn-dependent alcohol dehydrogenase
MTSLAEARVLFVAAAGPRRGFGHLVRCVSFARALGVRPLVAVTGARDTAEAALALGADVIADASPLLIGSLRPDVVIVDDPIPSKARPWVDAARRAGALHMTVHDDLGNGVLIAVGGNDQNDEAVAIAEAIVAAHPDAEVKFDGASAAA